MYRNFWNFFTHNITLHVPKFNFLLERIALVSSNNLIIQFVILIFFPLQKLKDKSVEQIEEKHGLSVIGFVDINFIWHILWTSYSSPDYIHNSI